MKSTRRSLTFALLCLLLGWGSNGCREESTIVCEGERCSCTVHDDCFLSSVNLETCAISCCRGFPVADLPEIDDMDLFKEQCGAFRCDFSCAAQQYVPYCSWGRCIARKEFTLRGDPLREDTSSGYP